MRFNDWVSNPEFSRRAHLGLLGLLVTGALAGCSDGDNDTDGGDSGSTTTEDEPGGSTTSDSDPQPEYSISADVPESAEVGEDITYAVTIRNDGDAVAGTYGLDISTEGESRWESVFTEEIELATGETESWESDAFALSEAGTYQWEFWIDAAGQDEYVDSYETVVSTPTLGWGDSFRTPTDLIVTASEPSLTSRYEYEDFSGDQAVHRAPDGEQFAFVELRVENSAGESRETPNILDFELVAGNRQFEPMGAVEYEGDDRYDGLREIVDGVVEEGILPYQIPDSASVNDLKLFYSGINFDAEPSEWQATWQ